MAVCAGRTTRAVCAGRPACGERRHHAVWRDLSARRVTQCRRASCAGGSFDLVMQPIQNKMLLNAVFIADFLQNLNNSRLIKNHRPLRSKYTSINNTCSSVKSTFNTKIKADFFRLGTAEKLLDRASYDSSEAAKEREDGKRKK